MRGKKDIRMIISFVLLGIAGLLGVAGFVVVVVWLLSLYIF